MGVTGTDRGGGGELIKVFPGSSKPSPLASPFFKTTFKVRSQAAHKWGILEGRRLLLTFRVGPMQSKLEKRGEGGVARELSAPLYTHTTC